MLHWSRLVNKLMGSLGFRFRLVLPALVSLWAVIMPGICDVLLCNLSFTCIVDIVPGNKMDNPSLYISYVRYRRKDIWNKYGPIWDFIQNMQELGICVPTPLSPAAHTVEMCHVKFINESDTYISANIYDFVTWRLVVQFHTFLPLLLLSYSWTYPW